VRNVFRSAAYRLAFSYAAASALAILLLGMAVFFAAQAAFRSQQDTELRREGAVLVKEYSEGGRPDLIDALVRRERSPINPYHYALFEHDRRIFGSLAVDRPKPGLSDLTYNISRAESGKARGLLVHLPDGSDMLVAIDAAALQRLDTTILVLFTIAFIVILVVGTVGTLALGRHLKRRLDRISLTARAIASGDLSHRIAVSSAWDEFDQVDAGLNAMLDRLTALLENLRQLSTDLAHDLRTPLSRLRAEIEVGLCGPPDAAMLRGSLERALEQSDAVLSLFAAILRIAEVEGRGIDGELRRLDLSHLTNSVCEMHAPALEDSGHSFEWSLTPNVHARGDAELVMQALSNLLDNAQSHTPTGTRIRVSLQSSAVGPVLRVADTGPGIPEKDRDLVVRRFVRLDRSRSREGHGLGLNLVAAVMKAHGGSLLLGENFPGLVATLNFPSVNEARRKT
jgi:signal transduction histidine kinase